MIGFTDVDISSSLATGVISDTSMSSLASLVT